jgi:hypothetical protein
MWIQLITFVLGALSALGLQFLSARLAFRREQMRESWVRRLNSYQDFTTASRSIVELWHAGAEVPPDQAWSVITRARKAAFDAGLYDPGHREQTERMASVTAELVRLASSDRRPDGELDEVLAATRAIWAEFAHREPSLGDTRPPRHPRITS